MKLQDLKLSELKEICSRYKCFQCPLWDESMNCCFFAVTRIPCQWDIEDEKGQKRKIVGLEAVIRWYQSKIDLAEEKIRELEGSGV